MTHTHSDEDCSSRRDADEGHSISNDRDDDAVSDYVGSVSVASLAAVEYFDSDAKRVENPNSKTPNTCLRTSVLFGGRSVLDPESDDRSVSGHGVGYLVPSGLAFGSAVDHSRLPVICESSRSCVLTPSMDPVSNRVLVHGLSASQCVMSSCVPLMPPLPSQPPPLPPSPPPPPPSLPPLPLPALPSPVRIFVSHQFSGYIIYSVVVCTD